MNASAPSFFLFLATEQTATVNVPGPISAEQCHTLISQPAHATSPEFGISRHCGARAEVEGLLNAGGCRRNGPLTHRREMPKADNTFWVCAGEPEILP
jgi:hypothetical protein